MFYIKPRYIAPSRATNYYSYYERDCLCVHCGTTIGLQRSDTERGKYFFDNREKQEYKYCPYCGCKLYEEETL